MKLSVRLEFFFKDVSSRYGWDIINKVGFSGCEFSWRDVNISNVMEYKSTYSLDVVALGGTTATSRTEFPDRPELADPSQRREVIEATNEAIKIAKRLECSQLIVVSGDRITNINHSKQRESIVEGLKEMASFTEKENITILLEPLNRLVDHKSNFLSSSEEAFAIIDDVGNEKVKILYDIYHMQIVEGNIIQTIEENLDKIGYFHIAGVPGRHEPTEGELDYRFVLQKIVELGYDGYICLEYSPSFDPEESLRLVKKGFSLVSGQ